MDCPICGGPHENLSTTGGPGTGGQGGGSAGPLGPNGCATVENCTDGNGNPVPLLVTFGSDPDGNGVINVEMTGDVTSAKYGILQGEICTGSGRITIIYSVDDGTPEYIGYIGTDGNLVEDDAPADVVPCLDVVCSDISCTCWVDDLNGDRIEYFNLRLVTVDEGDNIASTDLGNFTDRTYETEYTPRPGATLTKCSELGEQTTGDNPGSLTIVGEATYIPTPNTTFFRALALAVVIGPVEITDAFGNVSIMQTNHTKEWEAYGGLPLNPPQSIQVPDGSVLDVTWTEPAI